MKSNIFLKVIIFCCFFVGIQNSLASPISREDALSFAKTKGEELLLSFQEPDLNKRYQLLDDLFIRYVDVDYISKFVIGKYWRTMTKEQQESYRQIFNRYCLAYYKTLPLDFASKINYEVIDAAIDGNFTAISAVVHINNNPQNIQDVALVFRVHETNGTIKVVDVKIAESSMLLVYRSKFYQMITQDEEEIDWFLEDLEDTTRSWEESLKQKSLQEI